MIDHKVKRLSKYDIIDNYFGDSDHDTSDESSIVPLQKKTQSHKNLSSKGLVILLDDHLFKSRTVIEAYCKDTSLATKFDDIQSVLPV